MCYHLYYVEIVRTNVLGLYEGFYCISSYEANEENWIKNRLLSVRMNIPIMLNVDLKIKLNISQIIVINHLKCLGQVFGFKLVIHQDLYVYLLLRWSLHETLLNLALIIKDYLLLGSQFLYKSKDRVQHEVICANEVVHLDRQVTI